MSATVTLTEPPYPLHETIVGRINPEYEAFYNTNLFNKQVVHKQPISKSRESGILISGGGPLLPVASTKDISIGRKETDGPSIPIRVFTPLGDAPPQGWPVALWLHGGGWVIGDIDTENTIATHLANRAGAVTICVDYRLAPEHPYPAAVHDCWEALLWAISWDVVTEYNLDASRVAVGGSSAGGNLAAILAQRSLARPDVPRLKVQILSVPVCDNTATVETAETTAHHASWKECQHAPALEAEKMMWYRHHYLPDPVTWSEPEASPLLWEGDWSQLPPAIIAIGELDVLRSEAQAFWKKLEEAGVQVDGEVFKGDPHSFFAMDDALEHGRQVVTMYVEGLKKHL